MKTGTDLRIIKTQKALVTAMLFLLKQKPFEALTVQEICEVAMVRRATFYTHFADKYELLTFTIRTVYNTFATSHLEGKYTQRQDFYYALIEQTIDFLIENSELVYSLLQSELSSFLTTIIGNEITKALSVEIKRDLESMGDTTTAPELIAHYHINGFLSTFIWWLQEGQSISKEALIMYLHKQLPIYSMSKK